MASIIYVGMDVHTTNFTFAAIPQIPTAASLLRKQNRITVR